ncbi:hypothetical protein GUJ93_ZPchr0003g18221 [Zizania palustris]|uniref:HTH La-type RNA-binding domain-containing protein n=1 Tax=Zizania palustris TaxID=103762 RepID=A0A8J5VXA0_ZIZPA|nr:hypothetical protein GUJ93_ZPchr0003g18221 [Zizania palustris]
MEPAAPSASPDPEHPLPKRSPWKQPPTTSAPNGTVDAHPPPPAVIDVSSWPALSEAARTKPSDSPRPPSDSSSPVVVAAAAAAAAASAVANPSKQVPSASQHGRHKPARRADHSPRDHPDRTAAAWDHASAPGGRGAQRSHNNGGGGRRGAGSAGGFGGRRRGGFDGFYRGPPIGIGPYLHGGPPPPPPMAVAPPFMGPPPPPISPMRAFPGPVVFHEMHSPVSPVSPMYYVGPPPPPEALRGLPFAPPMVGPPPYPYYQPSHEPEPSPEPEPEPNADADAQDRRANLLKQIEFYFSKDNLCTDVFLRRNMDAQGWVNITLIAGFNKVQAFTDDLQYIKETIQSSSILEVEGGKIRRQNDWNKWVIPRESNPGMIPSSSSVRSPNINNLTAHLGGVGLHESAASSASTVGENHHEVELNGPTSSNNQAPVVEDGAGKL